jgi:TatD DNase family protein
LSYVDAHLHLADPDYAGRIELVMEDAATNNISVLLSNAVDYETSIETVTLARRYDGQVFAAVGVHPWTVTKNKEPHLDKFEDLLKVNERHIKAVGEIGLDGQYTQDEEQKKRQREVFRFFLELAECKRLPVVVHSRLAVDDVLETLPSFNLQKVLLHWYSGPIEKLDLVKDRGYLISVGPSILYSRRTSEIARDAYINMILSETDGPVNYHGPFEGKMTQPSFVIEVVRKLSEIKSQDMENVREAVWSNFQRFLLGGS